MGFIHLPASVQPGKQASVEAEFDRAELAEVVARLKAAVNSLTLGKRASTTSPTLPNGQESGTQESAQTSASSRPDDFSFSQADGKRLASVQDTPSLQRSSLNQPITNQGTALSQQKAQLRTNAVSADEVRTTLSHAEPLMADANAAKWKEVWRSDEGEHDRMPISAFAYVPATESLMGGDSPGGWLLSASNNLLNLWECFPGKGDSALQVMHSQMTDYEHMDLSADLKNERMLSTCKEKSRAYCVSMFSLSKSNNMLAPRHGSKVSLPPSRILKSYKGSPPLKVRWLHDMGGPLKDTLAASYDEYLTIYSITGTQQAKACWPAHNASVTQIHVSEADVCLYTADAQGEVSKWELRAKPKQAADKYEGLSKCVTGLQQISANKLLGTSSGGDVVTWDLRNSKKPLAATRLPDNGGADVAAFSPDQRLYALASSTGQLYTFEEANSTFKFQKIHQKTKFQNPVKSLLWNVRTCQLYSLDGASIVVYNRN